MINKKVILIAICIVDTWFDILILHNRFIPYNIVRVKVKVIELNTSIKIDWLIYLRLWMDFILLNTTEFHVLNALQFLTFFCLYYFVYSNVSLKSKCEFGVHNFSSGIYDEFVYIINALNYLVLLLNKCLDKM